MGKRCLSQNINKLVYQNQINYNTDPYRPVKWGLQTPVDNRMMAIGRFLIRVNDRQHNWLSES